MKDVLNKNLCGSDTLKVKGFPQDLKVGTEVQNICLVPDATNGHDVDCKIDGFVQMQLKSLVVKKVF